MYDSAALEGHLRDAGFEDIRLCDIGDANDPMFGMVEDVERFFDNGQRELAVEAIKPTRPMNSTRT
jgi:hypothetical protein